jgi:hypothetical protein
MILTSMPQGDAVWVVFELSLPAKPGSAPSESSYGIALVAREADQQIFLDWYFPATSLIPPERGSNSLSGVPEAGSGYAAMAGLVDSETDLVEFVESSFRVVGSAEPKNGAFIVAIAPWGQIRWYEDDEVTGAFPIGWETARAETQKVDSRARSVADRFVDAIISGRWEDAATHYASDFAPSSVLPQLAEIFLSHSHLRVGSPETLQGTAYIYPLRRGAGSAHLVVEMSMEGLQWKVYDYGYGVDD